MWINIRRNVHKSNLEYVPASSYTIAVDAVEFRENRPMRAYILDTIGDCADSDSPLTFTELSDPLPRDGEILVRVSACGICHTELDEIEGRTPPPHMPVVPGHQIIGRVESVGKNAKKFSTGDRVGIAWIHSSCGTCEYCLSGCENLCPAFVATGRDVNGGYAEFTTVSEDYTYPIPDRFTDNQAAPLLCGGAIGFRSLRLTGLTDGQNLGLTGFGASAHLILRMTRHLFPRSQCFVFARSQNERAFALDLGATWAGDISDRSPRPLHAIIDTTPAWKPVLKALENLAPGGRLVINAIRKEHSDIEQVLALDYPRHLWMEKEIKSVANVARHDVAEFLRLADKIPIIPTIEVYPFDKIAVALRDLKKGIIRGAKVLQIGENEND